MWFYAFIVTVCCTNGYCDDQWVDWDLLWDDCTWKIETYHGEGTPSCYRDVWVEE